MSDLSRFAIFTVAALALFFTVLLGVIRNRKKRPSWYSLLTLAVIVVPVGMIFARYSHLAFQNLPGPIYYGVPAAITFALPPLWLRMSGKETVLYLPLALCMAPVIHVVFSFFLGWHDYMPFPVYIPSIAELANGISR